MEEPSTETAVKNMEAKLQWLGDDAEALCKRHLDYVMAENKTRGWAEKSKLYAQARVRGCSLSVLWYEVSWYGKKATGTRRMVKTPIRKPARGHGYTIQALLAHAQPWEEDMVREVEAGLTKIRRKATPLSKSMLYLKQLERLEAVE